MTELAPGQRRHAATTYGIGSRCSRVRSPRIIAETVEAFRRFGPMDLRELERRLHLTGPGTARRLEAALDTGEVEQDPDAPGKYRAKAPP